MGDASAIALAAAMPVQPLWFSLPGREPWAYDGLIVTTRDQHNAAMVPVMCDLMRADWRRELEQSNELLNCGLRALATKGGE